MIKSIILGATLVAVSTVAHANESAYNVKVFDHTKRVVVSSGGGGTHCDNVEVPVYEYRNKNSNSGDVLGGMIIGGLIGKGITKKDNGAAVGAVIGGLIAADNNGKERVQTGYRIERQCYQKPATETYRDVYSHSTIRFFVAGKRYVLDFVK
jgi:uncharacterized protein YcfJ